MPGVLRPGREQPAAGTGSGALWANSKRATESHWLPNATFYTNKEKKKKNQGKITLISWAGKIQHGQTAVPALGQRVPCRWPPGKTQHPHGWPEALPRARDRLSLGALKNHSIPNKQERERAYGGSSLAPRFQMLWGSPLKEAQGARRWEGRRLRMHRTFT